MNSFQLKIRSLIQQYKLEKLVISCFVNFGIIFLMTNIVDMYINVKRPAFGGFEGQVLFGIIIAFAVTYSPWNRKKEEPL